MNYTIKILSHGRTVTAEKNELVADAIQKAGLPLSLYCNRRGLCGKCFIEILKGKMPSPSDRERSWLSQKKLGDHYRLACQFEIAGDLEINVPAASTVEDIPILPSISRSAIAPDPAVKKYFLEIQAPEIASPQSLFELILAALDVDHLKIPLGLLKDLGRKLEVGGFKVTVAVHREKEIIAVEPGNTVDRNFGLAVDVGTTTLVMDLVDLDSGKTLDTEAALNSQVKRGADVISRIAYAFGDPGKADELRDLVLDTLNRMIGRLLARNRVDPLSVYEIIVSGNTAMNHLLLGAPVETLATAPYHALFSRIPSMTAAEVGFRGHAEGKVYFSPNIRSFVGGDIASGLMASRLAGKRGRFLLIDLGTNGEIVLKTGRHLIATSTAAGPAFEGMNISCGMPALPGAIYKAEEAGEFKIFTLGGGSARGICGTGLIDLIAISLARGEISPRGAIQNEAKKIHVAAGIALTQDDIRQMQLACAAVKTGLRMLLENNGLSVKDLNGIYIAGAFGNYLNIRNSMSLGLLPRMDGGKLVFIGNSSLAGARLLLLSKKERDRVEALVQKIEYVSLASNPGFQDHFIQALEFRPWP
jgi:uncharacterized 2Fe-2S/4Fe-4S cluster protein (DUF4445 family)